MWGVYSLLAVLQMNDSLVGAISFSVGQKSRPGFSLSDFQ